MKQSCCVSNDEAIRKKQSSGERSDRERALHGTLCTLRIWRGCECMTNTDLHQTMTTTTQTRSSDRRVQRLCATKPLNSGARLAVRHHHGTPALLHDVAVRHGCRADVLRARMESRVGRVGESEKRNSQKTPFRRSDATDSVGVLRWVLLWHDVSGQSRLQKRFLLFSPRQHNVNEAIGGRDRSDALPVVRHVCSRVKGAACDTRSTRPFLLRRGVELHQKTRSVDSHAVF